MCGLVERYDGVYPKYIVEKFCDHFNMPRSEFDKICDSFTNPEIFETTNGQFARDIDNSPDYERASSRSSKKSLNEPPAVCA